MLFYSPYLNTGRCGAVKIPVQAWNGPRMLDVGTLIYTSLITFGDLALSIYKIRVFNSFDMLSSF